MAPEIALRKLRPLRKGSVVLDPMAGSGTVLRQAVALGHKAFGFDIDPLSILMSRVATDNRSTSKLMEVAFAVVAHAMSVPTKEAALPWMDDCKETLQFVNYWFAASQRRELRRLAYSIQRFGHETGDAVTRRALMLCLSKLIVTKQFGASLAWDVSHSRPHRVADTNDFEVLAEFLKACYELTVKLDSGIKSRAVVRKGDARGLRAMPARSVDAILTSPPYLNAIDYLRGHRLSLVWLGFGLPELRSLRAKAMGTERGKRHAISPDVLRVSGRIHGCATNRRTREIVQRYAWDLIRMTREFARVLKKDGRAHVVIGNSNIGGAPIDNASGLVAAARMAGLALTAKRKRELPLRMRYLPVPKAGRNALGRRMRFEFVLSFRKDESRR